MGHSEVGILMRVIDGAANFGCSLEQFAAGRLARDLARRAGVTIQSPIELADVPALKARVNHNRWIVDCATCNGAEYVFLDRPQFMCLCCFNGAFGGKWLRVTVPSNRASIESILKARPDPRTRNWTAGETLTRLRAENRQHGLPEGVA